jgi:mannose-6-phosphate isomerase-like protein (cupin superfamily)
VTTIRFASPETTPNLSPKEVVDADAVEYLPGRSDEVSSRQYHPGSETELQMFEVNLPPDFEVDSHAHLEAEIIYITKGELHFGNRVVSAGGSVFIDANTLYGFRSGSMPTQFINFRARADLSYLTKAEFLARRAEARSVGTITA